MSAAERAPLRVGIVNLMPQAEVYAGMLLRTLGGASAAQVAPRFIRLAGHAYRSSDSAHLAGYGNYADTLAEAPLDGLIITGAPVEELAYADVRYLPELTAIARDAQARQTHTLGLCWGGLFLAHLLGLRKVAVTPKLFGLLPLLVADEARAHTRTYCAQSRHAGLVESEVEDAARSGLVRPIGYGEAAGYTILESADGRTHMHLGHPEYTVERLRFEYERDVGRGRVDVAPPENIALPLACAGHVAHGSAYFRGWLHDVAGARAQVASAQTRHTG